MPGSCELLLVEDDPALADYLAATLRDAGYAVRQAADRPGAIAAFTQAAPTALALIDLGLPPDPGSMTEGLALLDTLLEIAPSTKIVVLTGQDEEAAAFAAIRRGAFDFLVKPASLSTIRQSLQRAALFVREEGRLAEIGEARIQLTARLREGPREVASAAEEQLLRRALQETGFNIAETARRLGLAREHLYYYLNKYGIRRPQ